MNIKRRLARLEDAIRPTHRRRVTIIWDGITDEPCRSATLDARRRGLCVNFVILSLMDEADTPEEAAAVVEAHRERRERIPIRVYRRGTKSGEVLAEWDPGAPSWMHPPAENAATPA